MAGAHKIVPRWGQPLTGIIALVVFTIIAWVSWFIFADPAKGIFKLYEQPFTAFLATMILVGVWQHIIFGDWPFSKLPPLQRGIVMTVTNLILTWFVIYVLFEFMGNIIPVFGTKTLLAQKLAIMKAAGLTLPEVGSAAYETLRYNAMNLKMAAVTYWVVTGFFTYPFWAVLFQKWPFAGKLSQPGAGMAEWSLTTVVTMFIYGILVLPHFTAAGIPGFLKAGLTPEQVTLAMGSVASYGFNPIWYAKWAPAGAQNYYWVFGTYQWMIIGLFLAANTWQGWPWNYVKSQPWRGLVGVAGIWLFAVIAGKVCFAIMDMYWGPMVAGSKAAELLPAFRFYHSATIGAACIMPFLAWHHYFDDIPNTPGGMWNAGWWIRFFGVFALAGLWMFVYYKISYPVFGLWPTLSIAAPNASLISQLVEPGQTINIAFQAMNKGTIWIFWWIIPLLWNEWFMHKWPFYVEEHDSH
jgi:AAT family amino acid transporter